MAYLSMGLCKPKVLGHYAPGRAVWSRRCGATWEGASPQDHRSKQQPWPQTAGKVLAGGLVGMLLGASVMCSEVSARLEPVNRPDLLPTEKTTVIDVGGFLTKREEEVLVREIAALEADTGIKLRLLAQSYPETPGLAVKDFWDVDDSTIVFVADPTFGGILNFNVGANVDLQVPRAFWSKLSGKFGNKFYWRDKGENVSIINAVAAIDQCLREPPSRLQCSKIEDFDK